MFALEDDLKWRFENVISDTLAILEYQLKIWPRQAIKRAYQNSEELRQADYPVDYRERKDSRPNAFC